MNNTALTVALGDVASFIRGITFKPEDLIDLNGANAVACMRTSNVQSELDVRDVWAVPSNLVRREDQLISEGDLLVSSANSWNLLGKCCWIPKLERPTTLGGFISALRAKRSKLLPRFLYYWFNSPDIQADVRSCGRRTTNISNLDLGRCLKLKIPLPPIAEQRRIAAILDQAEAVRAKRRQALAKLDTLTQSLFLDMFGRPMQETSSGVCKLGDICSRVTDGTHQPPVWAEDGVPFLFVSNIRHGKISFDTSKFISDATHAELTRLTPIEVGDILYTTVGTYGNAALVRDERKFAFQRHVAQLKPYPHIVEPEFLSIVLNMPSVRRQADRLARGVAQKTLNLSELRNIEVLVPAIESQHAFLKKARLLHKISNKMIRADEENTLFNSLQHRAFRGEL